jgi:hypothetical protein
MHSLCIVVDLHVAFNNIKPFCVAMETQEWVKFLLLSSYKIFRTSVNSINIRLHVKRLRLLSDFNQIFDRCFVKVPISTVM